jgi:hypothetical protein
LQVIDGLSFLADGSLYANSFATEKLFRIPVNADGSAGAAQPIETSIPLVRPDGLRTVGPRTLIQAEGLGRVTELTIMAIGRRCVFYRKVLPPQPERLWLAALRPCSSSGRKLSSCRIVRDDARLARKRRFSTIN